MFTTIWKTQAICTRLRALISGFLSNARGNVAVITALSALPIVSAIGCAVDYSMATTIKTKLQAAADAATLAAVSANSPLTATAKAMIGNGAVANGATYAQNFFDSNLSTSPANTGYNSPTRTATVNKNGTTVTATLSFTAQVPTFFLGILGRPTISLTGESTSSYTLPSYIDFYLMLDVSGSMGMPSTTAEMTRLQSVNPDNLNGGYPSGCTFACHFTAQGACPQTSQGPTPKANTTTNPSRGAIAKGSSSRGWERRPFLFQTTQLIRTMANTSIGRTRRSLPARAPGRPPAFSCASTLWAMRSAPC